MNSGMDNNDVYSIMEMDNATDQPLCQQPRLHAPQALASHPSASQVAQVASHPRGNPQHHPNTQASPSSAARPHPSTPVFTD